MAHRVVHQVTTRDSVHVNRVTVDLRDVFPGCLTSSYVSGNLGQEILGVGLTELPPGMPPLQLLHQRVQIRRAVFHLLRHRLVRVFVRS